MTTIKLYIMNILRGADRLLNAVFGGDSKEFMSTRVYRYKDSNWFAGKIYRFLDWLEPGHCESSYQHDYDPNHTKDEILK